MVVEFLALLKLSIQRLPTRLKKIVKWATSRKVPYLILCEAFFLLWLYQYDRVALVTNCGLLGFEVGSLILLAILEHRTDLPLPFMRFDSGGTVLVCVFALALGVSLLISCEIPRICRYVHMGSLVTLSFPNIMAAMNAGITEESVKVALTNVGTMALQRLSIVKRSNLLSKAVLWILGSASVAFWALLHIVVRGDSVGFSVIAFIVGMVYFGLVVMCKNYLPTVLAHAFYDCLALC